jgi:hypothetical protein
MCGLTGYMGNRHPDPVKLRLLLLDNEERGRHSTGMYGSRLMRKVGTATLFVQDPNFDTVARSNIVLGHTRHATGGAHTKENAHPFIINNDLVGTHNGWLVNTYEMVKKYGDEVKAEVDSHVLYKVIGKADDPKALSIGEGAMALAFKYKGDGFLYRRESRPLFIATGDGGIYYSSRQEGLRLCGFRKIYVLTPHVLYQIRNGVIINRIDMPKPRLEISESTYMSYWESNVSDQLKEELTGKKPIAPVASNTGAGTQSKATEREVQKDLNKTATQRLARYGEGLSVSVKRDLYNFLEFYEKQSIISKVYNYDSDWDDTEIVSDKPELIKSLCKKDVMSNSFISRKIISDETYSVNEHIPMDRAGFVFNLYGFDDSFGIRALDSSKFAVCISATKSVIKGATKKIFHNSTNKDNRIFGSVDMFSGVNGKNWVTITLLDTEVKGVLMSCTMGLIVGGKNSVNLYVSSLAHQNMRALCINGDDTTEYASAAYVSKDVTRLAEIMKHNLKTDKSLAKWDNLPFLKTTEGNFVKSVKFTQDKQDSVKKKIELEEADESAESKFDTCCISSDPFVGIHESDKKTIKDLELSRFYSNVLVDSNSIYDDIENLKTAIEKKGSDVEKIDPLSANHFALLEALRKLRDISTNLFYLKVDFRKTLEEIEI